MATGTADIEALHRDVDAAVAPLEALHRGRLACRRGCAGCCVDGLSVFEVEAAAIRRRYADLLREGAPHAEGACAFLDREGGCRIYESRPYVCRTQGLPLRWIDSDEGVESRDVCPLNEPRLPELVELPSRACWTLGPFEDRIFRLEMRRLGRAPTPDDRVRLRDLFRASECGP